MECVSRTSDCSPGAKGRLGRVICDGGVCGEKLREIVLAEMVSFWDCEVGDVFENEMGV